MHHTNNQTHVHSAAAETSGHTLDRMAPFYDKFVQLLTVGKERKARLETVDRAQIKPGDKILDVGCGTGNLTIAAAQQVGPTGKAFGIDPAPKMIEIAQRKNIQKGLDIDFRIGVIENLPFPDNNFDMVLSSLMMHHLPLELKARGLVEIRRVLIPGGRLAIVELNPTRSSLINFFHGGTSPENHIANEIRDLMTSHGYVDIEIQNMRYGSLTFLMGTRTP